jgi:hypothetical protein
MTNPPPMPPRGLARVATTGIYLVRGVPRDLQRSARARAVRERTTLIVNPLWSFTTPACVAQVAGIDD